MKAATQFLRAAAAAAATLLLANCATNTPQGRIAKFPERFNTLPAEHQTLVTQGKIKEGMNKDAVFLAWGPANDIRKGSKDSKPYEAWTYVGYDIVWDYTASFFRHRHHRNFYHPCDAGYYEPTAYYVPYAAGRVEFLNERVTGFDWKAR